MEEQIRALYDAITTLKCHTQHFVPSSDLPALNIAIEALEDKCKAMEQENIDIKIVAVSEDDDRIQGYRAFSKMEKHIKNIRTKNE